MGNRGDDDMFQWLRSMRFYQWDRTGGPSPLTRWSVEHPIVIAGVATAVIVVVPFVLPGPEARPWSVGFWGVLVLVLLLQAREASGPGRVGPAAWCWAARQAR